MVLCSRKGESHGNWSLGHLGSGGKEDCLIWPLAWRSMNPTLPQLLSFLSSTAADPSQSPSVPSHPCSTKCQSRGQASLPWPKLTDSSWSLLLGAFFGLKQRPDSYLLQSTNYLTLSGMVFFFSEILTSKRIIQFSWKLFLSKQKYLSISFSFPVVVIFCVCVCTHARVHTHASLNMYGTLRGDSSMSCNPKKCKSLSLIA